MDESGVSEWAHASIILQLHLDIPALMSDNNMTESYFWLQYKIISALEN